MQANTIAYTYNHDDDGGTTPAISVLLTRHTEEVDKTTYITAAHMDTVQQDTMAFYRTLAKRSGDSFGVERTATKRTKTHVVVNAAGLSVKVPVVVDIGLSIPVGLTAAEKKAIVMEHIGFLSSTEGKAAMLSLVATQNI
jgi:hypothetical protein